MARTVLPSSWVFRLEPWDKKTRQLVEMLHKSLSPNYRMSVRGRGPRTQPGDSHSIPLARAKSVVVYIYGKNHQELPTMNVPPPKKREPKKKPVAGGRLGDMMKKLSQLEGK
jgi:hypothetical protein